MRAPTALPPVIHHHPEQALRFHIRLPFRLGTNSGCRHVIAAVIGYHPSAQGRQRRKTTPQNLQSPRFARHHQGARRSHRVHIRTPRLDSGDPLVILAAWATPAPTAEVACRSLAPCSLGWISPGLATICCEPGGRQNEFQDWE